ncbi:flavin reductase family protein [Actinoplanes sp. NEAU-A11]|uniref:Flavin reductase family protein n=1 Tax=Actinoplanes aureus TaxID=2792083 RepID=A0A931CCT8_9ACTN|nr:flavin reductase family protein [Actinoplanes aureus]
MSHTEITDRFRTAFRRHPTGVAIISAMAPDGPVGLTASSVASVSVAPPALSFSVLDTRSARAILEAPSFVVNLLGAGHARLADDFARTGRPRFTPDQGWDVSPTGEPILAGAVASLRGTPLHLVPVGESTVVVAVVLEVLLGPCDGRLVYQDREFITYPEGIRDT